MEKTRNVEKFYFWKDNRLDQHFQLTPEELAGKFKEWLHTKDKKWINYYSTGRIIRYFIAIDEKGLSSVLDEKQFQAMDELLFPIINEYEKTLKE